LKNHSEGISQEEKYLEIYRWNIWTVFLERTWGDYWGNIWVVFLERIWGGSLEKHLYDILRRILERNIDHYILFVDINSQTNILKWNLKFILNLEQVWENFRIWIFGMLQRPTVGSPDSPVHHRTVRWILAVRRRRIPKSGQLTRLQPGAPDTVRCTQTALNLGSSSQVFFLLCFLWF
jgi:hypothetical protein